MTTQVSNHGGQFVFREERAPEELLELLRMRFAVYRHSHKVIAVA